MANNVKKSRPGFRQLERWLTMVIAGELVLFVLMLICGGVGILWLKILLGLVLIAVSGLGCALLIMMQEFRRKRSWWLLSAFGSIALCTLVSLIAGYPAPPVG